MTREEAREALSVLKIYDAQWLRQAIDMAIEALSEPSGDLISRADVFEIIDKAFSQPMGNVVTLYADICLMLNVLPTHANSRSTHERDLINRADAIEAVMAESRKVYTSEYANAERIIYEADAVEALAMLPSADAEVITDDRLDVDRIYCSPQIAENVKVVVRCKDCKHRDLFSCPLEYYDFNKDDDYCSWGERND